MKKVIINTCYGGFDVSFEAEKMYFEKKYPNDVIEVKEDNLGKHCYIDGQYICIDSWDESIREDETLIEVIEKLGEKANSNWSKLKIVSIPDDVDYEIMEYDGVESIHEKHRVWC